MENYKVTENFTIKELLFGVNDPIESRRLSEKALTPQIIEDYSKLGLVLQQIRNWANVEFMDENGGNEIRITILSGFRTPEWEKLRGRSGKSQHTKCADDFTASNCSDKLAVKINKAIYNYLHNKKYMGGLALKEPTYEKNKIIKLGFVHIDSRTPDASHIARGYGVRWYY